MQSILTARTIVIAASMAIGLVVAAQAQDAPAPSGRPIKAVGEAGRGEALVARWCGECHHPGTVGVVSDQAPSLGWIADQVRKDPPFIRTFLNHPHPPMPPLDLDRGEIEDVIAYFQALAAR